MTFLFSFIKALPFLIPFLKEFFLSSEEEKSKHCIRMSIVVLLSIIVIVIFCQQVYKLHLNQVAELSTLKLQYERLETENERLREQTHRDMDLVQKHHAEFSALSIKYDSLQRDYSRLNLEYSQILRLTVSRNGRFTKAELDAIVEGKRELDAETQHPICYFEEHLKKPNGNKDGETKKSPK